MTRKLNNDYLPFYNRNYTIIVETESYNSKQILFHNIILTRNNKKKIISYNS